MSSTRSAPGRLVDAVGSRTARGRPAGGRGRRPRRGHQRHHRGSEGGGPHPRRGRGLGSLASSGALGVDPDRDRWLACLPLAHVGGLSVVTRALLTGHPVHGPRPVRRRPGRGRGAGGGHPGLAGGHGAGADRRRAYPPVLLGGAAPPAGLPERRGHDLWHDRDRLAASSTTGSRWPGWRWRSATTRSATPVRSWSAGPCCCAPTGTAATRPSGPGGWLPTGDGGDLAPDGRLDVDGRLAEVIVTGGEKVWPAAVEAVLSAHPAVARGGGLEAARPGVGRAGGGLGRAGRPGGPAGARRAGRLVRSRLARWAAPKELVVVDALPRTASGKVRAPHALEG